MQCFLFEKQSNQINMRGSRNFRQGGGGGGGVQVSLTKKTLTTFCFLFFFVPEGGPIFSRGVQLFPGGGGSNCLFPIETHITCDFPEGVQTPCPPPPSASALELTHFGEIKKTAHDMQIVRA